MADEGLSQIVVEVIDRASAPFKAIAGGARSMADTIRGEMQRADAGLQGLHWDAASNRWRDEAGKFAQHTTLITRALDSARSVGQRAFDAITSGAEKAGAFVSRLLGRGTTSTGSSTTPTAGTSRAVTGSQQQLAAEVRQSIEAFAQLRRSIDITDQSAVKAFREAAAAERAWIAELGPNVRGVQALERELQAIERKIDTSASHPLRRFFAGLQSAATGVWNAIKRVGSAIFSLPGLIAGISIGTVAKFAFDANVEYQRLSINLTTLLGNVDTAKAAMASLIDIETKMPMTLQQITEGYIRLLGLGLSPTKHEMQMLANVAVLSKQSIEDLTLDMRSAAAGRMLPLKNSLESIGVILSNLDGKTHSFTATFHGHAETVKADAEHIHAYLVKVGEAFPNAAEDQMKTLGGEVTNLKTALFKLAVAVGESGVNTAFGGLIQKAIDWVNQLSANQPKIQQFIQYALDSLRLFMDGLQLAWDKAKLLVLEAQQVLNAIRNPVQHMVPGTSAYAEDQRLGQEIAAQTRTVAAQSRVVDLQAQLRDLNFAANKQGADRVDYLLKHPEDHSKAAEADRAKYRVGSSAELPKNPNKGMPLPVDDDKERLRQERDLDSEVSALQQLRALQKKAFEEAKDLTFQQTQLTLRLLKVKEDEAAAQREVAQYQLAATNGTLTPDQILRGAAAQQRLLGIQRERAQLEGQLAGVDRQLEPIRAQFGARELERLQAIRAETLKQLEAAEKEKANYTELARLRERLARIDETLTEKERQLRAVRSAIELAGAAATIGMPGGLPLPRGTTVTTTRSKEPQVQQAAATNVQRIAHGIQQTSDELGKVKTQIDDVAATLAGGFTDGFLNAFAALGKGSKSAGAAFKQAMLGAIAEVAMGYAKLFMAKGLGQIAEAIADPVRAGAHLASAAEYFAAAAAMAAIGGALGGAAGGGGGGGAGGGGGTQTRADSLNAADKRGTATVIWEGDYFDPNDPEQQERFRQVQEAVGDRRMLIKTRRTRSRAGR